MATLRETRGAIITLDGLPIGQDTDPFRFLLKYQGQSVDYALKHGGYAIEERDNQIRGHMAYLSIKGRHGYGVDGFIVRTCEELQYLSQQEGGTLTNDGYFTDEIAAPMLHALRSALNYTGGQLANINGAMDGFVMTVAQRFGIDPDKV
jgi:hypothetical protein